jgi:hypothetical protein
MVPLSAVFKIRHYRRGTRIFRGNVMIRFSFIVAACCLATSLHAAERTLPTGGHTLLNSRLTIVFGSTFNSYTTSDSDRVDAINWVNNSGATVSNYVTSGGPLHCGDPQEFWGEAYGDSGDEGVPRPHAVIGGITSKWINGTTTSGTARNKTLKSCDETLDSKATTIYSLSTRAGTQSSLKIERTFHFPKPVTSGNFRAYVPRLQLGVYPIVLVPDASGVVQTYNANNCPENCAVTDWNGKWIADDDGNGNGMAIFRDPAKDPKAQITVDWDGSSTSNNSAVTIVMPKHGWKGSVTEVEYLCFYDAKSWTANQRAKGKPPAGCNNVPS